MSPPSLLFVAALSPPVTGQSVAADALLLDLRSRAVNVTPLNLSKASFRAGMGSVGRVLQIGALVLRTWWRARSHDQIYITTAESVAGNARDLALLWVLGRKRSRTWLHLHGGAGMRELLSPAHPWLQRLNRHLLRDVAGVIALGERLAPIFSSYVPNSKVRIVKNFAADELYIDPTALDQKWQRVRCGADPMRVLFLSNHLPGKGHEEVLEAIARMPESARERMSFDFAGGFASEADRLSFLGRLGAHAGARHHGIVAGETKRSLLHAAHVFCLPTYYPYEGQPISILEAYAAGCAVVTTDHSGIFDIFTPGQNGHAAHKRDAGSVADALGAMLTDLPTTERIGRHNRELAHHDYRCARHLAEMRELLGYGQI